MYKEYLSEKSKSRVSEAEAKPKIKFAWHGIGGSAGCTKPLGICIILSASTNSDGSLTETDFEVYEGKLIISFSSDENGLTSDGYLPLFDDVEIDSETSAQLGLTNEKIAAGIYHAYYDEQASKYTAVVVDLE